MFDALGVLQRKQGWYPHYWNWLWLFSSVGNVLFCNNSTYAQPLLPSLSFFLSLSPQMPLPLESLAKSLWEQETWRANRWGTTIGIPLMLHSKNLYFCVQAASMTMQAVPPGVSKREFLSTSFCLETQTPLEACLEWRGGKIWNINQINSSINYPVTHLFFCLSPVFSLGV